MTTENNKHVDFDQFFDEQNEKGPTITIYGKVEELPPSLPANIMVMTVRMMKNKKAETQIEDLISMSESLFGKERFNEWLSKGLSVDQMETLITKVIELYTGTPSKRGRGAKR